MKIKNITLTVERAKGKPLVYAFNALTVGPDQFPYLCKLMATLIEEDNARLKKAKPVRVHSVPIL